MLCVALSDKNSFAFCTSRHRRTTLSWAQWALRPHRWRFSATLFPRKDARDPRFLDRRSNAGCTLLSRVHPRRPSSERRAASPGKRRPRCAAGCFGLLAPLRCRSRPRRRAAGCGPQACSAHARQSLSGSSLRPLRYLRSEAAAAPGSSSGGGLQPGTSSRLRRWLALGPRGPAELRSAQLPPVAVRLFQILRPRAAPARLAQRRQGSCRHRLCLQRPARSQTSR